MRFGLMIVAPRYSLKPFALGVDQNGLFCLCRQIQDRAEDPVGQQSLIIVGQNNYVASLDVELHPSDDFVLDNSIDGVRIFLVGSHQLLRSSDVARLNRGSARTVDHRLEVNSLFVAR